MPLQPPLKCLLIDDDENFLRFTVMALEIAGLEYVAAPSAREGLEILEQSPAGAFDVILLDVSMPDVEGWDVLLQIRELGDATPVIFVTANGSVEDRVRGLRMGADDYVVKPIQYAELVARIETSVRRRRELPPLEFGDVRMDLVRRKVERNGTEVFLSPREFDLLLALVRARGEVRSKEELLHEVWGIDFDPETSVFDVHLNRLRKKIDRHGRVLIETIERQGYRVVPHARTLPQPLSDA